MKYEDLPVQDQYLVDSCIRGPDNELRVDPIWKAEITGRFRGLRYRTSLESGEVGGSLLGITCRVPVTEETLRGLRACCLCFPSGHCRSHWIQGLMVTRGDEIWGGYEVELIHILQAVKDDHPGG